MKTTYFITSCFILIGVAIVTSLRIHSIKNLFEDSSTFSIQTVVDEEETEPVSHKNQEETKSIIYNGMTRLELIDKVNGILNSTISGKGELIVDYTIEKNVDTYLALAIMMHETGCKWECSQLVKQCNNVGGQHGTPNCGSGPFARFSSLDAGIKGFIDNLSNNYINMGLTTPNTINPKYAEDTGWASKVTRNINSFEDY